MKYQKIEVFEAEDGSIYKTEGEVQAHEINVAIDAISGTPAAVLRDAVANPANADANLVSAITTLSALFSAAAITSFTPPAPAPEPSTAAAV